MSVGFTLPVRGFKRNNPSNDGTIAADNTGAAIFAQTVYEPDNNGVTVTIPAGSLITDIRTYVATATTDAAMTVTVTGTLNGTATTITSAALGATERILDVLGTATDISEAELLGLVNVGPSDVTLTIDTTSAAGAQQSYHVISYIGRNPDGTITPQGQGLVNQ